MPGFDDRLTRELERAARPAAPDVVRTFEDVTRRRAHRAVIRRVQAVAVVVALLAGTATAFVVLDDRLEGNRPVDTPTPITPDDVPVSMLQWRPIVGTYPTGSADAPELTCPPRACSLLQVAAVRPVVLVDDVGNVFELGPAIADGTDVASADLFETLDGDGGVALVLDDDVRPIVQHGAASETAGVAIAWDGTVVGQMGGPPQEPITITMALVEAEALVDALDELPTDASPSATESPSEPEQRGQDIGLPTPMCDLQELRGLDLVGDGTQTTVWTGNPADDDGRCPQDLHIEVAADVTGDGRADVRWGPIEACAYMGCAPLGGVDLDADGDDELVVNTSFSIVDHLYFSFDPERFTLAPIVVAEPGHLAATITAGAPLMTSAGGDEGYSSWMRCEGYPEAPVLVWTWAYAAVDSEDPVEWHETKLQLLDDGMFHVVASHDFRLPQGQQPTLELSTEPACGIDFDIWADPNPG